MDVDASEIFEKACQTIKNIGYHRLHFGPLQSLFLSESKRLPSPDITECRRLLSSDGSQEKRCIQIRDESIFDY